MGKKEEDPEIEGICFELQRDFHHDTRVSAIAWSPETSLAVLPRVLRFCTAGSDGQLRVFSSNLKDDDKLELLKGHTDYVNSISYDPDKGRHIASTSDDHTCRIWGTDGATVACFPLGAPGMTVCWHPQDSMKIMVAEKKGIIRFYNVLTQQPIMSLDCGHMPLMSADWCHGNALQVAVMAGTDWFVFDTSRSSRPIENKQVHAEGGAMVRWSKSHAHLLATTGRPAAQVKICNIKTNQIPVSCRLHIANWVSWHLRMPILAVAADKKLYFWQTETV